MAFPRDTGESPAEPDPGHPGHERGRKLQSTSVGDVEPDDEGSLADLLRDRFARALVRVVLMSSNYGKSSWTQFEFETIRRGPGRSTLVSLDGTGVQVLGWRIAAAGRQPRLHRRSQ